MLLWFSQVEETNREREERLKGWSTFLEEGNQAQQNNTTTATAAKPAESSTATEPAEERSSTTEPGQLTETEPQPSQVQEEDIDSTDSSLAGSDEEA